MKPKRMTRIMVKELKLSKEENIQVLAINKAIYTKQKTLISGKKDPKEIKEIKIDLERKRLISYAQLLRPNQVEKFKVINQPVVPKKKSSKRK